MGLLDFLKPRTAKPAPSMLNDLFFKSGKDAIEYVKEYMQMEWKPNSMAVALVAEPILEIGILSAHVLVPKGGRFVELPTFTTIKAVYSKEHGKKSIGSSSDVSILGLKSGDLVTVMLAGQEDRLAKIIPETEGWIAFIIGKNEPVYSFRDRGWRVDKKYEL